MVAVEVVGTGTLVLAGTAVGTEVVAVAVADADVDADAVVVTVVEPAEETAPEDEQEAAVAGSRVVGCRQAAALRATG